MMQFKGFKPEAMQRIANNLGYQGDMSGFNTYLNQNPDKKQQMDMYQQKAIQMAEGGVPSKYKGFSKLPESVQRQMDSGLAEKYEYGGKVGGCRGGGAAIKGTKFTGCK